MITVWPKHSEVESEAGRQGTVPRPAALNCDCFDKVMAWGLQPDSKDFPSPPPNRPWFTLTGCRSVCVGGGAAATLQPCTANIPNRLI